MIGSAQRFIRNFSEFWFAISEQRKRQFLLLQLISLLAAFSEVVNLGALLPFLQVLANPTRYYQQLGSSGAYLKLLPQNYVLPILAVGFILIVAISTCIRVVAIRLQIRIAAQTASDLADYLYNRILSLPYPWHVDNNSSKVLTYLTKDVDALAYLMQTSLVLINNLAIVVFLGIALVVISPVIMLLVGGGIASFYLVVFRLSQAWLRSSGRKQLTSYQKSIQIAQESLGGIRDIILDGTNSFFAESFGNAAREYRVSTADVNSAAQTPRFFVEAFTLASIVLVSLFLALSGKGLESQLPILGTLSLGAYRILLPLQQCFAAVSGLQANQSVLERLRPFFTTDKSSNPLWNIPLVDASPLLSPCANKSDVFIRVDNVRFAYSDETAEVLKGISLDVYAGERLALVGSTGSGKSTTADIIMGLLKPTSGSVWIDGVNQSDNPFSLPSWYRRVAHVPQHIFLSDASFASNIAFGVHQQDIDMDRVQYAARMACIFDLIDSTHDSFDTVVGERGLKLSGGQRQRIGLARALYKRAELLVLDEATSALDNITEASVMQSIQSLERKITIIVIAHRLSTVRHSDRIVVLEHGKISGTGSYEELKVSHEGFRQMLAGSKSS